MVIILTTPGQFADHFLGKASRQIFDSAGRHYRSKLAGKFLGHFLAINAITRDKKNPLLVEGRGQTLMFFKPMFKDTTMRKTSQLFF
jgi:hypothetical protein